MSSSDFADGSILNLGEWNVPVSGGGDLTVNLQLGGCTVVVGRNGSGKSALGWWFVKNKPPNVTVAWLPGHRRLWFQDTGFGIHAGNAAQERHFISQVSKEPSSRHLDPYQEATAGLPMYDFARMAIGHAATVVDVLSQAVNDPSTPDQIGKTTLAGWIGERPTDVLNRILISAGLNRVVTINPDQQFLMQVPPGGPSYLLSRASDGEKSAVILGATMLGLPPRSALVIDEPERHLHRSLSPKLISGLLEERSDCHIVLLTHDLDLAAGLEASSTLVVESVTWEPSGNPVSWTVHSIPAEADIPESVRHSILGGRRRLLFVEGDEGSLDAPLYRILFPEWEILPVGGCEDVIRAVSGVSKTNDLIWVVGYGIVDRDERSQNEIDGLRARGVCTLAFHEVDNVLLAGTLLKALAKDAARDAGEEPEKLLERARGEIFNKLKTQEIKDALINSVTKGVVLRDAATRVEQLSKQELSQDTIDFCVNGFHSRLRSEYESALQAGDLDALLMRFPVVKMAGVVGPVAKVFGRTQSAFGAWALSLIQRQDDLREELRTLVAGLPVMSGPSIP